MKIGKKREILSISLPNCKDLAIEIDGKKYLIVYNTKLGFVNEIRIFSKSMGMKELNCRLLYATDFKKMYKFIFKRIFYCIRAKIAVISEERDWEITALVPVSKIFKIFQVLLNKMANKSA